MKRKLFAFLIVFFSISSVSFSIEPDIFVQSTVNRASKLLGENISKEEKIEKLKLIARETVDIKGIGFYTLGAKRKVLSDEDALSRKIDASPSKLLPQTETFVRLGSFASDDAGKGPSS